MVLHWGIYELVWEVVPYVCGVGGRRNIWDSLFLSRFVDMYS